MKFDKAGAFLAIISATFLVVGTVAAIHTRIPLTGNLIENMILSVVDAILAFWIFRKSQAAPANKKWRYYAPAAFFAFAGVFAMALHLVKSK